VPFVLAAFSLWNLLWITLLIVLIVFLVTRL
jgi:hypothetical protein